MVKFNLICKECNFAVANSNNVLGRHVRSVHKLQWPDYVVKHEYAGTWPLCSCGCGEKLKWKKGGFSTCIKEHSSRGEMNGMFGRKGQDSPNTGKVRTEEHKKRYSEAAKKQWETNRVVKYTAITSANTRRVVSDGVRNAYQTTNLADKISVGINQFWNEDPRAPELRKEASLRAIDLLEQGKIGPQAPFKTEWKFNPFTQQNEYMHSSWETIFLDQCIAEGKNVTKNHGFLIPYTLSDGSVHNYVPDFYAPDENTFYETKGLVDEAVYAKWKAAVAWCAANNMNYVMLGMSKGRLVELDMM